MSFDESLAVRCRRILTREPGLNERKMFGGLSFLLKGNMICGVLGRKLVVRVDPGAAYDEALKKPHVRPMDFTGRQLRGFVYVLAEGLARDDSLRNWLRIAVTFGRALPPKQTTSRKRKRS